MIHTRFAPSPNGPLHLGHAYAALIAHDRARKDGGAFLLRIEDIDGVRSRSELTESFICDLEWLALQWDGPMIIQSQRLPRHIAAGERLKTMGLLYPCQCSRAEIASCATHYGPDGPLYPGTCRHQSVQEEGAAWRLDMQKAIDLAGPLQWQDEIHGLQIATPEIFGDIVLLRKDAPSSYHLSATLDDAMDGITHVTRGADLFAATHIHRLLQALLDLPVPIWHHHALIVESDGRKLAKRRGSPALIDLRKGVQTSNPETDTRPPRGSLLIEDLRKGTLPSGLFWSNTLDSSDVLHPLSAADPLRGPLAL